MRAGVAPSLSLVSTVFHMVTGVTLAVVMAVTGCASGRGVGHSPLVSETMVRSGYAQLAATTTVGVAVFTYDDFTNARIEARRSPAVGVTRPAGAWADQTAAQTQSKEYLEESARLLLARIATNSADDIAGLADDYIDITAKGSRVRNVQTSVSRSSFEQNLIDSGYQPTVVSPGKNVVSYELNGTRYVIRDAATSTGGPTADFYPAGSSSFTLKIRLPG